MIIWYTVTENLILSIEMLRIKRDNVKFTFSKIDFYCVNLI